ncbi:MAG TPA: hypothetical protein VKA36_03685 [Solirubrobacterales bacterium]|nr:hypothetical protein [Solirubrobacterales bacterium]
MLAESLVRSLIRLVVTVAILAAIYLLILKPILDTTENSVNSAFQTSNQLQDQVNDSLSAAGLRGIDFGDPSSSQVIIGGADLGNAIENAPDQKTKRLLKCIDRADGNIAKIQRCARR